MKKKRVLAGALFPLGVRRSIRTEARFRNRRRWEDGVLTLSDGRKFKFVPGARLHDLAPDEHVEITYDPANRLYVVGSSRSRAATVAQAEVDETAEPAE